MNKYGLFFRTIEIEDAEFIVDLRTDPSLSRFLSPTSPSVQNQISWITEYKERENNGEEFYFLTLNGDDEKLGLGRIYNIKEDLFESGSWLYKKGLSYEIPVFGDFFVRDFGFEHLNKKYNKFGVKKLNTPVLHYQSFFKPELIAEDELNLYFLLSYNNYMNTRNKLLQIL